MMDPIHSSVLPAISPENIAEMVAVSHLEKPFSLENRCMWMSL